jgi:hypothetical protein
MIGPKADIIVAQTRTIDSVLGVVKDHLMLPYSCYIDGFCDCYRGIAWMMSGGVVIAELG